jgi:hypothetical protein
MGIRAGAAGAAARVDTLTVEVSNAVDCGPEAAMRPVCCPGAHQYVYLALFARSVRVLCEQGAEVGAEGRPTHSRRPVSPASLCREEAVCTRTHMV